MKNLLMFALAVAAMASYAACTAECKPALADPFVLCDGGVYYAYGTCSRDGIAVFVSSDLKSWTSGMGKAKGGLALHKDDSFGDKNFWAPEVYKANGCYVMCYTANRRMAFAFSDNPLGPFRQKERKPFFDFAAIDGSLFWDDDGRTWLFFVKLDGSCVICQAEMERDLGGVKPGSMRNVLEATEKWELANPRIHVTEGPFVVKVDGTYVLSYSANGYEDRDYSVGVATAKSIEGPWSKYAGNPVLRRRFGLVGTGHHSFFKDAHGRWKIAFHAHQSHDAVHPRLMHIANVEFFDANGVLVPDIGNMVE